MVAYFWNKLNVFLLGLFIIVVFPLCFSQEQSSLNGLILDKENGDPVMHAEVIIKPLGKGSVSDNEGKFIFSNIIPGEYELFITHLSYEPLTKEVVLRSGEPASLTIYLEKKVITIEGVEVREEIIDRLPYLKEDILRERLVSTLSGDIGSMLREIPGVSGIRKGGTSLDPVIRGYKFSQLNVKINGGMGIEGGCPNRMDPAVSHVDILEVENMEVIKGPFVLRYGPALGGVININKIKPIPYEKFQVHLNYMKSFESNWNGNSDHIAVNGGNERVYFRVSGNYRDFGDYNAGNGESYNTAFRKYNVFSQLGISPAENHEILLKFDRSYGRDVHYPALPMDERTDDTKLISIDYIGKNISPVLYMIRAKAYTSIVEHVMDNKERAFGDTVVAVSSIDAVNTGGNVNMGIKLGNANLVVGIDIENISKDGSKHMTKIKEPMLPELEFDIWSNANILNNGLFAEYSASYQSLDLVASLRIDNNRATSDPLSNKMKNYLNEDVESELLNLSLSLGITKYFGEKFSVGLALGRGVRSPDMLERFIVLLPVGYDNYDYIGNPQLKSEKNNEADITLTYEDEKYGVVMLNAFYSYVQDFITGKQINPSSGITPLSKGVLGVKEFYNADKVMLYGFEFDYTYPVKNRCSLGVTAAYVRGTILNPYYKLEQLEGNDALSEIPPLEANAHFSYELIKSKLIPGIALRFVAEQNYVSTVSDEKTTPGFVLADVNFDYIPNDIISFSGGVRNIFDRAYYEHLNRRIIGSEANFYEPGRIFYLRMNIKI